MTEDVAKKEFIFYQFTTFPELYNSGFSFVDESGFFEELDEKNNIWQSFYEYYKVYEEKPTKSALAADLSAKGLLDENYEEILDYLYTEDVPDSAVRDMFAVYYREYQINKLGRVIIEDPLSVDAGTLEQLSNRLSSPLDAKTDDTNIFVDDPDEFLDYTPLDPTGVDWLDVMMGGGVKAGQAVGYIMPSGGGKSTLASQLSWNIIKQERHCAYFTFEEDRSSLAHRIYINATGFSQQEWPNYVRFKELPEHIREKYYKVKPLGKEYLHFIDKWVREDIPLQGVEDVFAVIEEKEREGIKIDTVLIDWWGALKLKLNCLSAAGGNDFKYRRLQQEQLQKLAALAKRKNVKVHIFHQIAGEKSQSKNINNLGSNDGQEDKNFHNMFQFCFVTTYPDAERNVSIKLAKARGASPGIRDIYLDAEHWRFTGRNTDYNVDQAFELGHTNNETETAGYFE